MSLFSEVFCREIKTLYAFECVTFKHILQLCYDTFHFNQMYDATLFNLQYPSNTEVEWH